MDRLFHIGIGFVLAVVLVAGFLAAKSVLEKCKEARKRMMTSIAEDVYNERSAWTAQYVRDLTVDLIDSKLAEKEGEK